MENKLTIQYAVQCIEELSNAPFGKLALEELSHLRGIPMDACQDVLRRLEEAGILSTDDRHRFALERPVEEITALEILQALYTERQRVPAFKVLYQRPAITLQTTLHAVRMAQSVGAFPGEAA